MSRRKRVPTKLFIPGFLCLGVTFNPHALSGKIEKKMGHHKLKLLLTTTKVFKTNNPKQSILGTLQNNPLEAFFTWMQCIAFAIQKQSS